MTETPPDVGAETLTETATMSITDIRKALDAAIASGATEETEVELIPPGGLFLYHLSALKWVYSKQEERKALAFTSH